MPIVTDVSVLTYLSTADIAGSGGGVIKYNYFFDETVVTLGNIIMFEYIIQPINSDIPSELTTYGYISVENATQTGIVNQYTLAIPTTDTTLDAIVEKNVRVRAYTGQTSSSDVVVTDWSNSLDLNVPPFRPIINNAYFDNTGYTTSLYVSMKVLDNPYGVVFENFSFIVCYYYQYNGETMWKVSDPITPVPFQLGLTNYYLLTVSDIDTDVYTDYIFTTIHAINNWTVDDNIYYSVSYVSEQIVAPPGSDDNTPNITSIDYQVYNDDPVEYPGTQIMTVNWEPPGNAVVPYYYVDSYTLSYSINGGAYSNYATDLPANGQGSLTYDVNVGDDSGPYLNPALNLDCGASIMFIVTAITVNEDQEPSDASASTSIFKPSEPVTLLSVTNTTYDNSVCTGLTVNFTAPEDIGCGTGSQYIISINGDLQTPVPYGQSSYSIPYTGLTAPANGTITVYLTTINGHGTNNGVSNTAPYISSSFTLDLVYNEYLDNIQTMDLSWSAPTLVGTTWTVSGYNVYKIVGTTTTLLTIYPITNLTYNYDVPEEEYLNVTNLSFYIVANLIYTADDTEYELSSNIKHMYTFNYAGEPQSSIINYASGISETMDLSVSFQNPSNLGVPEFNYIKVFVFDNNGDPIGYTQINYSSGSTPYNHLFNNIPYSSSGSVTFAAYIYDANGDNTITYEPFTTTAYYITTSIPIFMNVVASASNITGTITSQTALSESGQVIWINNNGSLTSKQYLTDGTTNNFSITLNNTSIYTYTFNVSSAFFSGSIPTNYCITAANPSGVGLTHP